MASLPTSAPGKTQIDKKIVTNIMEFCRSIFGQSCPYNLSISGKKKKNLSHGLPTEKASHPT